jgi:hypothetical protein
MAVAAGLRVSARLCIEHVKVCKTNGLVHNGVLTQFMQFALPLSIRVLNSMRTRTRPEQGSRRVRVRMHRCELACVMFGH